MQFTRGLLVAGLVCGALGLGCDAPAPAKKSSTTGTRYDAVTIFRAVYFEEGAAKSLVNSWKLPRKDVVTKKDKAPQPAVAAEQLRLLAKSYGNAGLKLTARNLNRLANDVESSKVEAHTISAKQREATTKLLIARIRAADSTFFTRFGKNIRSGSHVKVEKMLQEGLARITSAAASSNSTTTATAGSVSKKEFDDMGGGGYDDYGGGYDDMGGGGYDDMGGGGGYDDYGGYDSGGYDDQGGGGYDDMGGYGDMGGGYDDQSGGYDQGGGYDDQGGGYDDQSGGYDQGGADQGGYDQGGDPTGGSADQAGGSADQGGGVDNAGDAPIGDQAAIQVNMTVYWDTAVAVEKVAAAYATLFWGNNEGGGDGIQTASFVNHVATTFDHK